MKRELFASAYRKRSTEWTGALLNTHYFLPSAEQKMHPLRARTVYLAS